MSDSESHQEPHVSADHEPHVSGDELRAALAPRPAARRSPVLEPAVTRTSGASRSWDWSAGISDGELSELHRLRASAADLEVQTGEARAAVRQSRAREGELRAALAELAGARPWQRRRVVARLVERGLLDPR